jgi:hypothetical protein
MKISEIIKEKDVKSHYSGVTFDQIVLSVPPEIEFIAFDAEFTDESKTEICNQFLAKIANWKLAQQGEVVIEFPPDANLDWSRIIKISSSMGIDLSFIPSESKEYIDSIKVATKELLSIATRTNNIYPITPYLEYLALEALSGASGATPNHPYIVNNFITVLSQEFIDEMKAEIKETVSNHCGGMENFNRSIVACAIAGANQVIAEISK